MLPGECYCKGIGTPKNFDKAFAIFQTIAPRHKGALLLLSHCYCFGKGCAVDKVWNFFLLVHFKFTYKLRKRQWMY